MRRRILHSADKIVADIAHRPLLFRFNASAFSVMAKADIRAFCRGVRSTCWPFG
jgi:hypothetical protein